MSDFKLKELRLKSDADRLDRFHNYVEYELDPHSRKEWAQELRAMRGGGTVCRVVTPGRSWSCHFYNSVYLQLVDDNNSEGS